MTIKRVGRALRFESLEERALLAVFTVRVATDNGVQSTTDTLSWAIAEANKFPDEAHHIAFDLAGTQNDTIRVTAPLPPITARKVTIDGLDLTLDAQRFPDQLVTLDGDRTSFPNSGGLRYQGSQNGAGFFNVQNIRITRFGGSGIQIDTLGADDKVSINEATIWSNGASGIDIRQLGSGATGQITITNSSIYVNTLDGIRMFQPAAAPAPTLQTVIRNNDIGLSPASVQNPNLRNGIRIEDRVEKVTIEQNRFNTAQFSGSGDLGRTAVNILSGALDEIRVSNNSYRVINGLPIDQGNRI